MKIKLMIVLLVGIFVCIFSISNSNIEGFLPDYGEIWQILKSDDMKFIFLLGMIKGMDFSMEKLFPRLSTKAEGLVTQEAAQGVLEFIEIRMFFTEDNVDGTKTRNIVNIINDIYKDSANTYIPVEKIFWIAYQKLKGENIEPLLQKERKKVWQ